MRRNPIIADLFHRMKYMERRGSGLRKIVTETEKLPGYSEKYKPEFFSSAIDFRVVLKNVNYDLVGGTPKSATKSPTKSRHKIQKLQKYQTRF